MNTVLGVMLLLMNGQIVGGKAVSAYPNVTVCHEKVSEYIKQQIAEKGAPPAGVNLAAMCVDLTDDLGGSPHVST